MSGTAADRKGDLAAAQSSWEKALSLDPKHGLTLQALPRSWRAKGITPRRKDIWSGRSKWSRIRGVPTSCYPLFYFGGQFCGAVNQAERSLELGKNAANGARLPMAES